ncbi:hypothetical protein AM493_18635 [Flavobacterium akiainvivens]|uniref:Lipocalin-like domain-containing protein n=1 Tax=Flavobacterium akiainvivens TaxID=1202724 RepID=A0A0M8ML90_9FLAO|nr:hypothetical protein [Flavobacterium akiainvivens]KOS07848.1 hypothetical protein AM493_18635 [Flavobacterium akiainvivens]SFQ27480.1 hypothetical protein SAMN05444144_102307 [Flavobacterium akiainvivens]
MKKLLFTLTLFIAFATQAQTLTEKDLLGTWKLSTSTMHGVLINFETGKVTTTEGYEDAYSPEEIQKIEQGIKGEHPFPLSVTFDKGNSITFLVGKEKEQHTYELIVKNGKTFIGDGTDEYEVQLENATVITFFYANEDDGNVTISFKK